MPSTFLAAELKGGKPLEPETSVNTTAGLVIDTGPFTLTADYFRVDLSNRLALSQTFTLTEDERALLISEGIASAGTLAFFRFFINDFSSRNQGIDLVSTYTPAGLAGNTVFSFAMNYTHTELTEESDLLTPGRRPRPGARRTPDPLERRRQPEGGPGRPAGPRELLRLVGRPLRRPIRPHAPNHRFWKAATSSTWKRASGWEKR